MFESEAFCYSKVSPIMVSDKAHTAITAHENGNTAWCKEISSLTSLTHATYVQAVTTENQFHCTKLYKKTMHNEKSSKNTNIQCITITSRSAPAHFFVRGNVSTRIDPGLRQVVFFFFQPDEDQGSPGRNVVSDKKVCWC